ncbi:hypothetical protein [Nevskia ramosa]|uniref:hypothetical protein n=1 Tax=Nevskia ramosa TaxID=64002 RepID=UPI0003B7106E|nr:hypothetical protein [Nevskia ramosa]
MIVARAVHRSHAGPMVDKVSASWSARSARRATVRRVVLHLVVAAVVAAGAVQCDSIGDEHGAPVPAGVRS